MSTSTAPTLTNVVTGSTKLTLYFSPPANNGGETITNYKYTLNNGVTFTTANVKISPITVTGLRNGTLYQVALKAVNASGDSPLSNTILATPAALPSAPSITSLVAANSQLTINFQSGSNGGAEIVNYKYSTDGGTTYILADTANSPIVVTGLTNGNTYVVKLKAITAVGEGPAATSTIRLPTSPTKPAIKTIAGGDGKLMVTFSAPNDNGGLPIISYKYSVNNGPYVDWTGRLGVALVNPITITGLDNGVNYSIKLKAVNGFGVGEESVAVAAKPFGLPSYPTIYSIGDVNDTTVIDWQNPVNNGGSPVTKVKYSTNGGASWKDAPPSVAGQGKITIVPRIQINSPIVLRAVNAAGDGTISPVWHYPGFSNPEPPTITKITDSTNSISVAFSAPKNIGGSAIQEYRYAIEYCTISQVQLSEFQWQLQPVWDYNDSYITTNSLNPLKSPFVITKPANKVGHVYRIKMKSVNGAGGILATSDIYSIMYGPGVTAPDAPVLKFLSYDNLGRVNIQFNNPANTGGMPINNYYYCIQNATTGGWDNEDWYPINILNPQYPTNTLIVPRSPWGPPAHIHRVRIKAANAVGNSVASNALIIAY
jgi:hypothetical protein